MPFTLAHPAAVLPLRPLARSQTLPLILGSIAPDLLYYVPARFEERWAGGTHTWLGSVTLDLPLGLVALLLTISLRRPLAALMSSRARALYLHAVDEFLSRRRNWWLAPLGILVGVWTHLLWDEFTHPGTGAARHFALLRTPVSIGGYHGELSHVLQYVSSVLGLVVLIIWYLRLPLPAGTRPQPRSWSGWPILLGVLVTAVIVGTLQAREYTEPLSPYYVIYLLLTRIIAWFVALYVLAGALLTLTGKAAPD
jgi:hypothetical protein